MAIGGIKEKNIMNLKGTNVAGAAVVSAVFGAEDIKETVQRLLKMVKSLKER